MPNRRIPIAGWKGVDNSAPVVTLDPSSFKSLINWMIIKGRLLPFPKLSAFQELPTPPLGVLGARTFQDVLGNYHTVFFNEDQPFYLNQDGSFNPLLNNGNEFIPPSNNLMSTEVYLNNLIFANGGFPVSYIQGDDAFYMCGDVPGTCLFLGKLAAHLMLINTTEPAPGGLASVNFPYRVRWSASGNFLEYNTATDETAGFEDIADVEDMLTGWSTIGTTGFAFRTNGITAFSPTGVALSPFYTENFSTGPKGVGCSIPYTLATYGPFCAFVATDDIYVFDGSTPTRIGGRAKKSIFADLNTSTQAGFQPFAIMVGSLLGGIDYLSYWLFAPLSSGDDGVTSLWIYHFDSQSWVNEQLPFGIATMMQNIAGVLV